jgi:hypothetical protein
VLAVALGAGACLGPLPVDEYTYTCRVDGDCVRGNLCIGGECKPAGGACETSGDCGTAHCCDTFAFTYTCVPQGQACSFGTCNGQSRTCE